VVGGVQAILSEVLDGAARSWTEVLRNGMISHRTGLSLVFLSMSLLLLVGCERPTPGAGGEMATGVFSSPLSAGTSASTPVVKPTATPLPTPAPLRLVILHTNDNWGETEPCG
jgi:hypothetical protein